MTALQLSGYIAAAIGLQLLRVIGIAILRYRYSKAPERVESKSDRVKNAAWEGLREFRVTARDFEESAQTQYSFNLAPVDGVPLLPFKPGQFLTFSLPVAGTDASSRLVRCYSMSDIPDPDHYRITVKRAIAPQDKPEAAAGIASGWLHDQAQKETILQVRAPAGQFVFSTDTGAPPVFIAGGIGITPILSMLKAALAEQPNRVVYLFYGVRNSDDHAFRAVLSQLEQTHPGFDLHVVHADPATRDVQGRDYHHVGFISLDLLQRSLPPGRHAF